jgi:hypothetical protein
VTIGRPLVVLAAALGLRAGSAQAQQTGPGGGEQSATLLDTTFHMATYRSPNCAPRLVLAVFHGNDRDAGPIATSRGISRTPIARSPSRHDLKSSSSPTRPSASAAWSTKAPSPARQARGRLRGAADRLGARPFGQAEPARAYLALPIVVLLGGKDTATALSR